MRDRSKVRLTDAFAKKARSGIYWDTQTRGLLLRVTPAGTGRAWCLNYRVKDTGRERRITIGDTASWPIEEARKRAAKLRRIVDEGGDPLTDLEDRRAEPTVAQAAERFFEEALPSRAARTAAEYRAMLVGHVLPAIGRLKLSAVEPQDIAKIHRRLSSEGKKRRADAVVTVASLLFAWAVKQKMIANNPCKSAVERNATPGRERFLSTEEFDRLLATLDRWQGRKGDSCDTIRLLMLTGARRGELLAATWDQFGNLDAGVWSKPAASTKQRRPHRVPLNDEAIAVLRRREAQREATRVVKLHGLDHVFNGGGDGAHVNRLERDWREIRAAAGLEDVRLHDLRHSYASVLVGQGLSLPIIGALLGHSKPATTHRYAHLADQPLRAATAIIGKLLSGGKGAGK